MPLGALLSGFTAGGLGLLGQQSANRSNENIARQNMMFQEATNRKNESLMRESWARDDTAYQRKTADMKAAGLNPLLAAGGGAQSSSPIQVAAPKNTMTYQNAMMPAVSMASTVASAVSAAISAKRGADTADKVAATGDRNADTNAKNAETNAKNAETNAKNAETNAKSSENALDIAMSNIRLKEREMEILDKRYEDLEPFRQAQLEDLRADTAMKVLEHQYLDETYEKRVETLLNEAKTKRVLAQFTQAEYRDFLKTLDVSIAEGRYIPLPVDNLVEKILVRLMDDLAVGMGSHLRNMTR